MYIAVGDPVIKREGLGSN